MEKHIRSKIISCPDNSQSAFKRNMDGDQFGLALFYMIGLLLGGSSIWFISPSKAKEAEAKALLARARKKTIPNEKENNDPTSTWDGDNIPKDELEKIRKQFRLTHSQMREVIEASQNEANIVTPHQKLNRMVYVCLFTILIYVLNRDYGNIVTKWLILSFPKEARILRIIK